MHRRILLALAVVAASLPALALASDRSSERRHLTDNRALWARQHLSDYRFRLRVDCFCPSRGHAVTVTVRDGRPHGAADFQKRFDTVPEMFTRLRHALYDPKAGKVAARYDARRGFPRTASIDQIKNAIDDEIGWTVDRFKVLRPR